jgi:hypothetical protein
MKKKPAPKRAKKGSIATLLSLRLDAELAARVAKEAKKAGLTQVEWVRRQLLPKRGLLGDE